MVVCGHWTAILKDKYLKIALYIFIPEDLDLLLLPDPVRPGDGLQVVLRVEVAVKDHDPEKVNLVKI